MLTGKAKTDYQREYMRRYRSNKKVVRPKPDVLDLVRPNVCAREVEAIAKQYGYDFEQGRPLKQDELPQPQSHNPMMVGYVPPKGE